jgi:hypothetical protein
MSPHTPELRSCDMMRAIKNEKLKRETIILNPPSNDDYFPR